MEAILKTTNLTKDYKDKRAVDKVNVNVRKGDIYGFLGQNGAGKTTTIRMIMGLIKPTEGEVIMFGKKLQQGDYSHYSRIGSLIETSGFYPNLTTIENLEIHKRLMGVTNKEYMEEALEMTGMLEVRNKKVKEFSLGMRQRLGIARALLHRPELLILDEPTNGLDPVGIKEIRHLIMDLASKKKITIFLSSHILSEIQLIATRIGIIHNGKLLEEIDFDELKKKNRSYIEIKVDDDKNAVYLLENKVGINDYVVMEKGLIRVYERLEESSKINHTLCDNGLNVTSITVMDDTLEDYFINLTGDAFNIME